MMVVGPEDDVPKLQAWIERQRDEFAPLVIDDALVVVDDDVDGQPILRVTLQLRALPEGQSWPTEAVSRLYHALSAWGRVNGYLSGPYAHLQTSELRRAG